MCRKDDVELTNKGLRTRRKTYYYQPTNGHITTADSPAQSECSRGRIWVIAKFVVDGGALELVDTSVGKVTWGEAGGYKEKNVIKTDVRIFWQLERKYAHLG